jgi:Pyridine nucleotide-disulphide oxidoreductase/NADH:flavin oxidoreductase / NADH oxidase family
VNCSAGVHHAFIHTSMEFEPGWEKGYARAIREVSSRPVLLVGRISTPEVAEMLLENGDADARCLVRHLFTDPDWAVKAVEGRAEDIRKCVAANFCWKCVSRGGRVQCIYNREIGREAVWGKGTLTKVQNPKKVLVIGGGPSGLEFARVAVARGHQVVVLEREAELGDMSFCSRCFRAVASTGTLPCGWLTRCARTVPTGAPPRPSLSRTWIAAPYQEKSDS